MSNQDSDVKAVRRTKDADGPIRDIVELSRVQNPNVLVQVQEVPAKDFTRIRGAQLKELDLPKNRHTRVWFTQITPPMIVAENRDTLTNQVLQFLDRQRKIMIKLYSERRYLEYRREVVEGTEKNVRSNIERRFANTYLQ